MSNAEILKATFDVRKAVAPERGPEGSEGLPWYGRDGAGVKMDWRQALAMEGRVFCFNLGNVTSAVAGKAADIDQPQVAIRVPTGVDIAMIPLEAHIYMEDTVSTAAELIVACASIDIGAGTSTEGNTKVQNMKSGASGSKVIVRYTYSGTGTAAVWGTNYWELQRTGALYDVAEDSMTGPELHYKPLVSPVLVPPATFYLFYGSAGSSTGYVSVVWAEVPLSTVTA